MYVILIPEKRLLVLLFDQQNDNKFDLILLNKLSNAQLNGI